MAASGNSDGVAQLAAARASLSAGVQAMGAVAPATINYGTPSGRENAAMAYDPAVGFVVMYGGLNISSTGTKTILSDTWGFQTGSWAVINAGGPPPLYGAAMTYEYGGVLRMVGGMSNSGPSGTCWTFSGTSGQGLGGTYHWTQTSCPIGPRYSAGMAYDANDGYMVLFGGMGSSGVLGDTWICQKGTWTNLQFPPGASPSARYNFSMVYDSVDGYVLLNGGMIQSGGQTGPMVGSTLQTLNDTWKFTGGAWTNITAIAPPPSTGLSAGQRLGLRRYGRLHARIRGRSMPGSRPSAAVAT